MTPEAFGSFVERFGLPLSLSIFAIWGLVRGLVVPRAYYERELQRADYWRDLAMSLLQVNYESARAAQDASAVAREAVKRATGKDRGDNT